MDAYELAKDQLQQHSTDRLVYKPDNPECLCGNCTVARALQAAKAEVERLTRERDALRDLMLTSIDGLLALHKTVRNHPDRVNNTSIDYTSSLLALRDCVVRGALTPPAGVAGDDGVGVSGRRIWDM